MRRVEVTVHPKRNVRVETKGFAGASCRDASRALERALGQMTDETLTAEYHQARQDEPPLRQSS